MAIASKQIGQSTESNLLWNISKQIEWLTKVAASSFSNLSGTFVPYTGATGPVNLGPYNLTINGITAGAGATNTFYNTIFGRNALLNNTSGGIGNTAIGSASLEANEGGYSNIAIGAFPLYNNINGSLNIGLGNNIANYGDYSGTINIGHDIEVIGDYTTAIGNIDTLTAVIYGNLVLGGTADNGIDKLQVNGTSFFNGGTETSTTGGNLLTTGTGAGWTGVSYASGYTHISGANTLVSSTTLSNDYYYISWQVTNRTLGSFYIQFGNFIRTNLTTSGDIVYFVQSAGDNFNITPTSDFNGTISVSVAKITSSTAVSKFNTINSQVQLRIISEGSITIGDLAGALMIGNGALSYRNSLYGNYAGYLFYQGSDNTLLGHSAAVYFYNGNENTIIGSNGGIGLEKGSNNTVIGSGTVLNSNDNNVIIIGQGSETLGSNTTVIGKSNTLLAAIYGNLLLGGTKNHNSKLDVNGDSLQNGNMFFLQPVPTAKTVTGTLTIANLLTSIITVTSSTAVSLTLPTGTLTDAGVLGGLLPINNAFDWTIINKGSLTGITTILAGATHTIVGLATIAINSQGTFRTTKTSANTFVSYRVS